MKKQFSIGDYVVLRSGGPRMVIIGFVDRQYIRNLEEAYEGRLAVVQWMKDGFTDTTVFSEAGLDKYYDFCLN